MTQPKIDGVGHGVPRMLYASDGSNWYAILVDSDGHVKVDVATTALPTDAATETTLALIKGYVDNLEVLLAGGLPAALDSLALKVKEQSPLTGFATSANQTTMITALQLIDDLRAALGSVNTDDLQVDVKTSALPTDAATQTTLASALTALQTIDDFALGTNKIFGYYDQWLELASNSNALVGANHLSATVVPAGEIWVSTFAVARNTVTNPTLIRLGIYDGATYHTFTEKLAPGVGVFVQQVGQCILHAGDRFDAYFTGCVAGDDIWLDINGYKMKVA